MYQSHMRVFCTCIAVCLLMTTCLAGFQPESDLTTASGKYMASAPENGSDTAVSESENGSNPASNGYLVQVDFSTPRLFASVSLPELSDVAPEAGWYQADSLDDVRQLEQAGLLVCAEPNYAVILDTMETQPENSDASGPDTPEESNPDTPGESDEGGEEDEEEIPWYIDALGVPYAWEHGLTGQGIRIGIIDSGLYAEHEDLAGTRILPGKNYTATEGSDDENDTSDTQGHGTFVAGLIAAGVGNGVGIQGIAPDVELVPLKCFEGSSGDVACIVRAIRDSVDIFHCRILNMSFGITYKSTALYDAVKYACKAGTVVVSAVGNLSSGSRHNVTGDQILYPAAWPEVIGVGAVDQELNTAYYSRQNGSVWLSAPGSQLMGLSRTAPNMYISSQGTSFATPMVTAAMALALCGENTAEPPDSTGTAPGQSGNTPDLTDSKTNMAALTAWMELLKDTARDRGAPGYDTAYGYGVLDIRFLLAAARGDAAAQIAALADDLSALGYQPAMLWAVGHAQDDRLTDIRTLLLDMDDGKAKLHDESELQSLPDGTIRLLALHPDTLEPLRRSYLLRQLEQAE